MSRKPFQHAHECMFITDHSPVVPDVQSNHNTPESSVFPMASLAFITVPTLPGENLQPVARAFSP